MEIKLKISDVRDIQREGTTSDVKRSLHVMEKSLPLVFTISTFTEYSQHFSGCERNSYFTGISMLSRGFVSAVSLLRASGSRVFTASIKGSLYTRLNGRTLRPVSSVLCRHMSNKEKRSTAGGKEC